MEQVTKIVVFVAAPGDVATERKVIANAIADLNIGFASSRNLFIELRQWETHVWPGFGEDAQDVINQRVGPYDIFIGVFWNRLGTPTGRAQSGTAEEFERAYASWKQHRRPSLMLYFRRSPADLASTDEIEQKRRLLEFKETLQKLGALIREYSDIEEFSRLVSLHLIQELTSRERSAEIQNLRDRVDDQQRRISEQEKALQRQQHMINELVRYSMAEYIFKHLQWVYHGQKGESGYQEYIYHKNQAFERDIRFLRDHGFIEYIQIGSLHEGDNLVKRLALTPIGKFYVSLREKSPEQPETKSR